MQCTRPGCGLGWGRWRLIKYMYVYCTCTLGFLFTAFCIQFMLNWISCKIQHLVIDHTCIWNDRQIEMLEYGGTIVMIEFKLIPRIGEVNKFKICVCTRINCVLVEVQYMHMCILQCTCTCTCSLCWLILPCSEKLNKLFMFFSEYEQRSVIFPRSH